jgi:UDP-N-acetylmuramoyl-L-alanyl-D-glutamate--2,6-diaminopimelate ligase
MRDFVKGVRMNSDPIALLNKFGELKVTGVAFDSRRVQPGEVFFAIHGTRVDGHDCIPQAVERGAVAVMVEREIGECPVPVFQVESSAAALSVVAARFFDSQMERRISVGVTGTNGKTSVAFLLAQALAETEGSACYAGTLGLSAFSQGSNGFHFVDSALTSPDPVSFHGFVAQHPGPVVTELSSISLHQRRLEALELDLAIFTNLTRDHLDYHKTMESYLEAKRLLFSRDLEVSRKQNKAAILNLDDEASRSTRFSGRRLFYSASSSEADCHVVKALLSAQSSLITFSLRGEEFKVESHLIGRYNVENLNAVALSLHALGYSIEQIGNALTKIRPVPGRLERVFVSDELPVAVIDYAHSPDALEKAISSVREISTGKVVTVFGCGGDRDRGKRPIMGEIAARLSDKVVVTSDNPRTEDPEGIIREICRGISEFSGVATEVNRRAAIEQALSSAGPGDLVLIAGKGHEPYQEIGGVRHHFSDVEEARRVLLERMARV